MKPEKEPQIKKILQKIRFGGDFNQGLFSQIIFQEDA
jgi:hypothetical protein